MTLHTYTDAAGFLAGVQDTLELREDVNGLTLGIAQRTAKNPPAVTPYFAAVHSSGALVAAAIMTPPYDVQITGDNANNPEALELIARNIRESMGAIPGVVAQAPVALAFAELYASINNVSFAETVRMRLYRLDELVPAPRPSGVFRRATEADTDLLTGWAEAFHREAVPNDPVRNERAVVVHRISQGELYLWENGEPVSMAGWARPTRNGCTVNFVYTPQQYRGRGYAGACTAALTQHLLDTGYRFCVLFTDLANPTSNSIYQRIGYRPVCDFTQYRFQSGISQ